MRLLLSLLAAISVTSAAVVRRDVDATDNVEVTNSLSDTPAAAPLATLKEAISDQSDFEEPSISARDNNDVVELFVKKGNKGQYYYYSIQNTDNFVCKNYVRLVSEMILSVRQKVPSQKEGHHVSCDYYAEPDCGTATGKMTQTDDWKQPDLSYLSRRAPGDAEVLGSWADHIRSVQCFWVRSAARRTEETGSLLGSNRVVDTPDTAPVTALTQFNGDDPVELHSKKEYNGDYHYYSVKDVTIYFCKNIGRKGKERILSARQKTPPYLSHMSCDYYAEPDCGTAQGKLTRTDNWEQPDLAQEPRKVGDTLLGTWEDRIRSVQCFWVRAKARTTEEMVSLLESTNAHEDVLDTSDGPALFDETPIAKDLELRDASTHNNDRLTRLYAGDHYFGDVIAYATQQDAEREYCIKTKLKKGVFIRSIQQYKDSEDSWFVCWYHDDDNCNSKWNPNGVFPAFYLERDASIETNFAYKIMSFRCRYADPGKRAAVSS
ncbi:hypothetical protein P171DRAFT_483449 [Karstenula rhodostoma CBS 690.94]|uniref:Uncharacterized protein n=1 Tax=Karstenula rhodostoma CBS 690.94 TaxID=1392251 RepID=A0A9P4PL62_9PLEO|nr:hypothetical protein P171DRAFT_483449 [Karstenula rhodostoma CBS 690.94]